jgi:hypothetical protein
MPGSHYQFERGRIVNTRRIHELVSRDIPEPFADQVQTKIRIPSQSDVGQRNQSGKRDIGVQNRSQPAYVRRQGRISGRQADFNFVTLHELKFAGRIDSSSYAAAVKRKGVSIGRCARPVKVKDAAVLLDRSHCVEFRGKPFATGFDRHDGRSSGTGSIFAPVDRRAGGFELSVQ